jgi:hypothetical protein
MQNAVGTFFSHSQGPLLRLFFLVNDKFFRGKNTQEWSEDTAGVNLSDHDDETTPSSVKLSETRYSPRTASTINLLDERLIPYDLIMRLLEHVCFQGATPNIPRLFSCFFQA